MSEQTDDRAAQTIVRRLTETLRDAGAHLSEQSAKGALARGKVFQIAGHYANAERCYQDAVALDPNEAEAAARLAIVEILQSDAQRALKTAMELAARHPTFEFQEASSDDYVSVYTVLGDALVANGRVEDAVEGYKLARSTSKRDTFAAGRLAQLYMSTGEGKKALEQAPAVAQNARFRSLVGALSLGERSTALMPRNGGLVRVTGEVPGRPLLVDGDPVVAAVVQGDETWCAELPG